MKFKRCLVDIIYKNKLCITENPFGIKRLWPYSYVEYFYNDFCNRLIKKNNSPNILEVNQTNKLNLKMWELFFDEPKIEEFMVEKVISNNFKKIFKYDLVIINNDNFFSEKIIINKLICSLKPEGTLVVENIGYQAKEVLKFYLKNFNKLRIEIMDFRLNSFILNNCILVIRGKEKNVKLPKLFFRFLMLIKFLITEFIISVMMKIFKKIK